MKSPRLFAAPQDTIAGAGRGLRSGDLRCVDLVEQCLSAIDQHEAELAAWVHVDRRGARAQAQQCDRDFEGGIDRGCLQGIPVGIKDIIDVAGFPTGGGSRRLQDSPPAAEDAVVVHRLRQAGAVILGKTVTTPFACYDPPATRNPWHTDHTPGGSSSGSAVAVATGMCYAALGSQTGGSITRPAAYCGVTGLKPTFRRVHLGGVLPVALALDHVGPLGRCVQDLAAMFAHLCGDDSGNPSPVLDPPAIAPSAAAWPLPAARQPIRIGCLSGLFVASGDAEALTILQQAVDVLASHGVQVVQAGLPVEFPEHAVHHRRIMAAEAAAFHDSWFSEHPDDYPPGMTALIEEGRGITASEYIASRAHQSALRSTIDAGWQHNDVWVCLAAPGPAPGRDTTGSPAFNAAWSYLGLPTVTFPLGLTANGLPIGIQLVGRRNMDAELLSIAAACECLLQGEPSSAAP